MSFSDPIADLLTRIRNALSAEHAYVDVPWSKLKQNIAEVLKQCGFIDNYITKHEKAGGTMRIFLKYTKNRESVIQGLKRISTPGRRSYVSHDDIPHFFGGLGVTILSTSSGVVSGQEAYKKRVGGELLCLVW